MKIALIGYGYWGKNLLRNLLSLPNVEVKYVCDTNLTNLGELAFVIGTQVSTTSTYEMADAVTVTAKDSADSWVSAGAGGTNRTAEATIDLHGSNVLVIVPTTCSADSRLLIKGH